MGKSRTAHVSKHCHCLHDGVVPAQAALVPHGDLKVHCVDQALVAAQHTLGHTS